MDHELSRLPDMPSDCWLTIQTRQDMSDIVTEALEQYRGRQEL